jgi:histidinol-phosphate aminotransferase
MAALRLGMALASPALIQFFNKVKSPYNINVLTQEYALEALQSYAKLQERVAFLLQEREKLQASLLALPTVQAVYPTDANFILVKIQNAPKVYHALLQQGIVVRNRSNVILCQDCLRITVGTPKENKALMQALESYKESYK